MSPHKWGVCCRRITGYSSRGPIFRSKVMSRHKSEIAAKARCGFGEYVRRLTAAERQL